MNADKYTTKVREALGAAQNVAQHHGQQQFDAEHVLFALLKDSQGLIPNLFTKIGANLPTLTAQMEESINRKPRITGQIEADKFYISNDLANILMRAEDAAKEMKDEYVSVEHLILGIMRKGDEGRVRLGGALDPRDHAQRRDGRREGDQERGRDGEELPRGLA